VPAGNGRRTGPSGSGDEFHEDIEIFNIDSGWDVKAVANDRNLLDELDGWGVASPEVAVAEVEPDSQFLDDVENDDEIHKEWEVDGQESRDAFHSSSEYVMEERIEGGKQRTTELKSNRRVSAEEDLLRSLPDHLVRELIVAQEEALKEEARLRPAAQRREIARRRTHRKLKIIAGSAAGKRILSPQGDQTRPMMEMVRGAVYSMITGMHGTPGSLPDGSRWLDLFAGTGAIGIEAISRGCVEAHFIELSPWVVSNCLLPNIEHCEVDSASVVHTGKAEDFLRRALKVPRFAGGAFDFISVCPPYELVSYPELFDLLEESPLVHDQSIIVVEYPKKLAAEVRECLGPLVKLKDRKYGRTFIALYGPQP